MKDGDDTNKENEDQDGDQYMNWCLNENISLQDRLRLVITDGKARRKLKHGDQTERNVFVDLNDFIFI